MMEIVTRHFIAEVNQGCGQLAAPLWFLRVGWICPRLAGLFSPVSAYRIGWWWSGFWITFSNQEEAELMDSGRDQVEDPVLWAAQLTHRSSHCDGDGGPQARRPWWSLLTPTHREGCSIPTYLYEDMKGLTKWGQGISSFRHHSSYVSAYFVSDSMLGSETLINKTQGLPSRRSQSRGQGRSTEAESCLMAECSGDHDGACGIDTQVLWGSSGGADRGSEGVAWRSWWGVWGVSQRKSSDNAELTWSAGWSPWRNS